MLNVPKHILSLMNNNNRYMYVYNDYYGQFLFSHSEKMTIKYKVEYNTEPGTYKFFKGTSKIERIAKTCTIENLFPYLYDFELKGNNWTKLPKVKPDYGYYYVYFHELSVCIDKSVYSRAINPHYNWGLSYNLYKSCLNILCVHYPHPNLQFFIPMVK